MVNYELVMSLRKKIYTSVEELQTDLDSRLVHYNSERPRSGKFCYGKTPMQTFLDSVDLAREKLIDSRKLVFGNSVGEE